MKRPTLQDEAMTKLKIEQECREFVPVPETTLPDGTVVPAFEVAKYFSSRGDDGRVVINASGAPWIEISYYDAVAVAEASGFKLITETQALSIAHNIANQDINWTGGKVGEGSLFMGLHKRSVEEAQAGNYISPDPDERRWFELSNGELIFDVSGNAFSWVFDDVQGDERGVVAKAFAEDSPSLSTAPYPSMQKGIGDLPPAGTYWTGCALARGGDWFSGCAAGAFSLSGGWPCSGHSFVGFRVTRNI